LRAFFTGNVERVDEDSVGYGDAALIERWSRQIDQLSARHDARRSAAATHRRDHRVEGDTALGDATSPICDRRAIAERRWAVSRFFAACPAC
jgi:hypothetical protein